MPEITEQVGEGGKEERRKNPHHYEHRKQMRVMSEIGAASGEKWRKRREALLHVVITAEQF